MRPELRCNVSVTFAAARNFAEQSTDANPIPVHPWWSCGIAVRRVCRRVEAQELCRPFRSGAFSSNRHAWVDDFERGKIIRGSGGEVDDLRRDRSVLIRDGGDAADDEIQAECSSSSILSHCGVDDLRDGGLVRLVTMTANESSLRHF